MSIATMTRLGYERDRRKALPKGEAAAGEAPDKSVQSALQKLSAFIPSEVIGIYVAGFGIFKPSSKPARWWIFGVTFVLLPIIMYMNYKSEQKHAKSPGLKPNRRTAFILFLFGAVAFLAWVWAMPGNPFLSVLSNATQIGGFAVVILAIIMYKAADLLDVIPKGT